MTNALLAIESSCDETSAALIKEGQLASHVISNQKIHTSYGGVVPELAGRAHQKNILAVVKQTLEQAGLNLNQLTHIGFTQGPGLLGPLLVGSCFAKGLAYALKLPLIAVHHMKAHVLANFIEKPHPTFPFLALVVSGGHTQLILAKDYLSMELLGQTKDDAIGEAFDKIAKMMGLPYPGGVWIDGYAKQGNSEKFTFPNPKVAKLDFSFSGIKTAFRYFLEKHTQQKPDFVEKNLHDLCASIQATLVNTVINKVERALKITGVNQLVLGGGVAANSHLRAKLYKLSKEKSFLLFVPSPQYCTDNAAMIAMTAYYQMKAGDFCHYQASSLPKMPL